MHRSLTKMRYFGHTAQADSLLQNAIHSLHLGPRT